MSSITDAIRELQKYPHWVCYIFLDPATEQIILYQNPGGPKPTKPPINPHRGIHRPIKTLMASVRNPDTWGTYQQAAKRLTEGRREGYRGLGYVFSHNDPFCGIDLDGIRNPETEEIVPWAADIIRAINSYTEISVSGTGVHILIRGSLAQLLTDMGLSEDDLQHRHPKGIEIYDDRRYFTVSARHLDGTPTTIQERQLPLEQLYFDLFYVEKEENGELDSADEELQRRVRREEKHEEKGSRAQRPDELETAGLHLTLADDWIIEQAARARGGRGAVFERLWAGNASDFPAATRGTKKDDTSRADLALCGILAYWTRCNADQMDRLFRKSGLYTRSRERREKWERYGRQTIALAIKNCRSMYNPAWAEEHRATRHRASATHLLQTTETRVSAQRDRKAGN